MPSPHAPIRGDGIHADEGLTFTQWVARRAIPFDTVEPRDDDGDLAPLTGLVGGRKYGGVGEATHGSHEFFAMKAQRASAFTANLSCADVDYNAYQSLSTSAKNDCRTKVLAAYQ